MMLDLQAVSVEEQGMTLNRRLTLAVLFIAATAVAYFSGSRRFSRQPRVFVAPTLNRPDAEVAQITRYFEAACPDALIIQLQARADYTVAARWFNTHGGWAVALDRKGESIYYKQFGSDAIEAFRQTCAAIRDDARETADSETHTTTGRYLLYSSNPEHVFLVDTRTGAVWHLQSWGTGEEFQRVAVDGLYDNNPLGIQP